MSQCRKNWETKVPGYLLVFTLFISFACFSNKAISQDSTSTTGRHRHERPKHPSFKKMLDKVNIFKKHKNEDTTTKETKQPDPAPAPPPPPPPPPKPQQKTDSVKPKTTVKHTSTKKKTKKATTPAPGKQKPKTDKQATPII